MRSSASLGAPSDRGSVIRSSSSTSSGANPCSSSVSERRWISARRARPASSRGELADHAADTHDLGGLLDQLGGLALRIALALGAFRAVSRRRHAHAVLGHHDDPAARLVLGLVGRVLSTLLGARLTASADSSDHTPAEESLP